MISDHFGRSKQYHAGFKAVNMELVRLKRKE